ncbi:MULTISPECIES: hypothetical protein [Nostoc]|uniref:hypothetical protein n=1 Tax=Nostoc TaxID=1177 RepID=UPI001682D618|nr:MULTISPECIES: hypothetical protein [Nostoc]MBD2682915.1 hypothetical protein [Nostoc sp. FACHB-857]
MTGISFIREVDLVRGFFSMNTNSSNQWMSITFSLYNPQIGNKDFFAALGVGVHSAEDYLNNGGDQRLNDLVAVIKPNANRLAMTPTLVKN